MIFTEKMRKIEFLVLKSDIERVLTYLGKKECLQLQLSSGPHDRVTLDTLNQESRRIEDCMNFLGLEKNANINPEAALPGNDFFQRAETVISGLESLFASERQVRKRLEDIEKTLHEVRAFIKLDVPFSEIEHLTFLTVRIGKIPIANRDAVLDAQEGRLVLPLDETGRIIALASKKGRWALDSDLKKHQFQEITIPEDLKGVPSEIVNGLLLEKTKIEEELASLELRKADVRKLHGELLQTMYASLKLGVFIEEVKGELESTQSVFRLTGWIPRDLVKTTISDLESITAKRIAIRVYRPEEVDAVKKGTEAIPVKLKHGKIVTSFQSLVFSYGAPLYGTIDPTPIVSVFFILLFAIMFGDLGQGFVGLVLGIILHKGIIKSFRKWQHFGMIFILVGAASMVTGLLYGSVFASENLLVPVTRAVTEFLFGTPKDRIIEIMPTEGLGKLFAFFGFTIGLGVVINSIGLIINIYNQFALRRFDKAIFSKTGLAGATFFWYVISIAVRIVLGGRFHALDAIGLAVPLFCLVFGHPLYMLITGKRPILHEGIGTFFIESIVEIIESVSYYFSNSMSFLRVAAFALSHTVLSLIVFKLIEIVGSVPGSFVFQFLIFLVGNALILTLEAMIVAIQVVRLQYYEFFSKFFTESGEKFKPFSFQTKRSRT